MNVNRNKYLDEVVQVIIAVQMNVNRNKYLDEVVQVIIDVQMNVDRNKYLDEVVQVNTISQCHLNAWTHWAFTVLFL